MAKVKFEKYVSTLPAILSKNTVYFVKVGAGFDVYVTNDLGTVVAYPINGSAAAPAGSNKQVQYNNNGIAAGASNVAVHNGFLEVLATPTKPALPDLNAMLLYLYELADYAIPTLQDDTGYERAIQEHLYFNKVMVVMPSSGTTLAFFGIGITAVGTISTPAMAITNWLNQIPRTRVTSVATAGGLAYFRGTNSQFWRGNAVGLGGFFVSMMIDLSVLAAGMRAYFGITTTPTTAPTNIDPLTSTTYGKVGLAINTNTGNWNLIHNNAGTAPTVIPLGVTAPVNITDMYRLSLFSAPNGASISYAIHKLGVTPVVIATGVLSANIPANNLMLGIYAWATNNVTAAAVAWETAGIYIGGGALKSKI